MINDPAVIDEMLRTAKTIAVVGMSDKSWRASHNIGRYLADNGYRVLPVNPALSEILGHDVLSRPRCGAGSAARRADRRRHRSGGCVSRLRSTSPPLWTT